MNVEMKEKCEECDKCENVEIPAGKLPIGEAFRLKGL